jgi:hypothetical protein
MRVLQNSFKLLRKNIFYPLSLINDSIPKIATIINDDGSKRITLSDSAQQAVWASLVIKSIVNAQPPKSISEPSLREKLINLQIDSNKYHFD